MRELLMVLLDMVICLLLLHHFERQLRGHFWRYMAIAGPLCGIVNWVLLTWLVKR